MHVRIRKRIVYLKKNVFDRLCTYMHILYVGRMSHYPLLVTPNNCDLQTFQPFFRHIAILVCSWRAYPGPETACASIHVYIYIGREREREKKMIFTLIYIYIYIYIYLFIYMHIYT